MLNLENLTNQVCKIAEKAGAYLKEERINFSLDKVQEKGTHDYVSYVDKSSEKLVVEELKKILPKAGFITEEKSEKYNGEKYYWVIDPLDGTTNYIHDNAPYAVSIALRKDDDILIGVVYEICREECFYAWKGGGAYVNGKRINVNKSNDINKSLLCLELPYNYKEYAKTGINLIKHFYGHAAGIRINGSAATALCYVAAGRYDGWSEKYIGMWDIAAGSLLVIEAGGVVTTFNGSINFIDNNDIIASNGVVHKEMLRVVNI